ncbi:MULTISPECIES: Spy/CpxP family protein refolding chaperone [unclassified Phenylobacterium]|uniref:Spy/CpxP family protein refolding chaperone n=1 Tax=unclassified Phenylobacterium TaxID=2640670 RepID=UPI000839E00F|nr:MULTISPECIES: Spy/CpxP family protein refolding chaperone [unclassified Phenylobacterium]
MTRRLILGLVPAALALASFAHAQPAPPHLRGEPPSAELKARHEAMRKQHLEDLKTVLRLRPDQEPALAAFVEAHKPKIHERKGPAEPTPLTTPQRLEEMSRHEAEMRAHLDAMRQALAKFYAALSPEQQKVFDALQRLKGPRGGTGPHMMMGVAGRPGDGPHMMIRRRGGPDDDPPAPSIPH